jgi:hypothetical protein
MGKPVKIPFPLSSFPGANPQEGAGRLIGYYAEPLGEASKPSAPAEQIWRGIAGVSQFAITAENNYRGGLQVKNLSYEVFASNVDTVDATGNNVTVLGNMPGTKKVSIARNQATSPDVVAVDVDNGAYALTLAGVPHAPTAYNGGTNLPQPNSVAFQDGYFFFSIADGRIFASGLNALTQNALTFTTCQAKSDVTLLRVIPFNGYLLCFTTGSLEVQQDAANAAPAYPYARVSVIETSLVQSAAIAGYENGFGELLYVASDFGVYWITQGSFAPVKVSPPDLDRLIEAQVKAGNLLEAGTEVYGGKKFWNIASPAWTWEINLATRRWHEKVSWSAGQYVRSRRTCGHPAFGQWIVGDQQSGNLLFVDDTNFTENGAYLLSRIESGPVREFPEQLRIARADFDFVFGVGQVAGTYTMTVLGAASGTGGVVRLTVNSTSQAKGGDEVKAANVTGTTEANGVWPVTVVDANHVELQGSKFVNAYVSGGTVTDLTAPAGAASPTCAISCSKNGGQTFDNPTIRSLFPQGKVKRSRASVKNRGQSGAAGVRWRVDITDPVYRGFFGATMSADPREVRP